MPRLMAYAPYLSASSLSVFWYLARVKRTALSAVLPVPFRERSISRDRSWVILPNARAWFMVSLVMVPFPVPLPRGNDT
jgi:hypothetical protein